MILFLWTLWWLGGVVFERNVQRRIQDMSEGYSWDRLTKMVKKTIGIF